MEGSGEREEEEEECRHQGCLHRSGDTGGAGAYMGQLEAPQGDGPAGSKTCISGCTKVRCTYRHKYCEPGDLLGLALVKYCGAKFNISGGNVFLNIPCEERPYINLGIFTLPYFCTTAI